MEPVGRKRRGGHGFPPWMRLHKGADFRAVFDNRCCCSEGWLAIHGLMNGLPHARFGSSIGKRLVGNNCKRNRVRRLLREAVRLSMEDLPTGIDFVLTSRRGGVPRLEDLLPLLPKLANQVQARLATRSRRLANPEKSGP